MKTDSTTVPYRLNTTDDTVTYRSYQTIPAVWPNDHLYLDAILDGLVDIRRLDLVNRTVDLFGRWPTTGIDVLRKLADTGLRNEEAKYVLSLLETRTGWRF